MRGGEGETGPLNKVNNGTLSKKIPADLSVRTAVKTEYQPVKNTSPTSLKVGGVVYTLTPDSTKQNDRNPNTPIINKILVTSKEYHPFWI
jgi:hypothetical protein